MTAACLGWLDNVGLAMLRRTLKEIRNSVRRDPIPFVLSAAAIALGIGPGWPFMWSLRPAEYDPTNAVLTATLVALIWTADYTFHSVRDGRIRDEREDQRRKSAKKSIIVGVAAELEGQYVWLLSVNELLYRARMRRIDRPMMAEALRNTYLLEPIEVALISGLSTHLEVIESLLLSLIDSVSRKLSGWEDMNPTSIEATEPVAVAEIREDIRGAKESIRNAARVLDPDNYVGTNWARLDAAAVAAGSHLRG